MKNLIDASSPVFGYAITYPAAGIIENVYREWDWLWIDDQHGELDRRSLLECVRTADALGLPPVVRVAAPEPHLIGPALDMGPAGIMVPMVETAAQAARIVDAAHFPPRGSRSFAGRRVNDLYGSSYLDHSAKATFIVAQIETATGLEHVEEIAAVEGLSALFLGPADIKLSLGLPSTLSLASGEMSGIVTRVADAARRHGLASGTVSLDEEDLAVCLQAGLTLMATCVDARSITAESVRCAALSRSMVERHRSGTRTPHDGPSDQRISR